MSCRYGVRHWFSVRVGMRSPVCTRCAADNPRPLTLDDWEQLIQYREVGGHLQGSILTALDNHLAECDKHSIDGTFPDPENPITGRTPGPAGVVPRLEGDDLTYDRRMKRP